MTIRLARPAGVFAQEFERRVEIAIVSRHHQVERGVAKAVADAAASPKSRMPAGTI